jgi:hypothetical protein
MMYHRTPASGRVGRGGGCGPVGPSQRHPKDPSPAWLRKAGFSFRESGDRSKRAAYGPAVYATTMPAWIMPRSGMTRPAPTCPSTPVADAQRRAVYAAPHHDCGFSPFQGPRQTPGGRLFVTLADPQRKPTAPRKGHLYGWLPARGWRVRPRRVVIIGCERRLFVNTPAKNWAMTVRQIGWLKVHPSLGQKTETMIPYVASGVRLSRPWPPIGRRQRRNSPLGLAQCPPLAVFLATGSHLQGKAGRRRRAERSINSINKAPGGRWGRVSRVCTPVARGVRYNWKGPPIGLPPCTEINPGSALNTV